MPETRLHSTLDLTSVPKSAQVDLCVMAIARAAAALESPEGREAIERGKQEYLRHLAERERSDASRNHLSEKKGGSETNPVQKGDRMKAKKVPPPVCKTGDGGGTNDMITHEKNTIPVRICQAEAAHGY